MSLATCITRTQIGIDAVQVNVEVHLGRGLPGFSIVGMAETSVKESKERVRSAIINSHYEFPSRKIIVNLSPADVPKSGTGFDLAIAIGILIASKQIDVDQIKSVELVGELALSGELRRVESVFSSAVAARMAKRQLITASDTNPSLGLIPNLNLVVADSLLQVGNHLSGKSKLPNKSFPAQHPSSETIGFEDVLGQQVAKRAMQIAAAGGHHLLMFGPPGTGKSMLAERFPLILPELTLEQALETAAIHCAAGVSFDPEQWCKPAFRSPHHTSSAVALIGGTARALPGEVSLAHHGVLFLDELTQFNRQAIEALREPLETGKVSISRAASQASYPARFQLIAALNPSPSGHYGNGSNRDTPSQILRYLSKLSGPFLDRMHLQVELPVESSGSYGEQSNELSTENLKASVIRARQIQYQRQQLLNVQLPVNQLKQVCALSPTDQDWLSGIVDKGSLSHRLVYGLRSVARTIADLSGEQRVCKRHLLEALQFRAMDNLIDKLSRW